MFGIYSVGVFVCAEGDILGGYPTYRLFHGLVDTL